MMGENDVGSYQMLSEAGILSLEPGKGKNIFFGDWYRSGAACWRNSHCPGNNHGQAIALGQQLSSVVTISYKDLDTPR